MQTHTSREIAEAMIRRSERNQAESAVIAFALSHLPGSTKVRPVKCRTCGHPATRMGFACDGHYNHTEDGVMCVGCGRDATEYVWLIDGEQASLEPVCDFHKWDASRCGELLIQVKAVRS